MKKMLKKNLKECSLKIGSFSTNCAMFRPISIIRQFFLSVHNCSNIKYPKDHLAEFEYEINNYIIHTLFEEIKNFEKYSEICKKADFFIIFIDLEKDDTYNKLDIIFAYIKEHCDLDKKFYFLGIYTDTEKIKENLKEENINQYLENKKINCEYMDLNIDSTKNLIQIFEFLICETIDKKYNTNIGEHELEDNQAGSKCNII